jgi:hypothetical protein
LRPRFSSHNFSLTLVPTMWWSSFAYLGNASKR